VGGEGFSAGGDAVVQEVGGCVGHKTCCGKG
jgi:hypothetical protein